MNLTSIKLPHAVLPRNDVCNAIPKSKIAKHEFANSSNGWNNKPQKQQPYNSIRELVV